MTVVDSDRTGAAARSRYLEGNYAPTHAEGVHDLKVVAGALPSDLEGIFARNGSNPRFEPRGRYHWFDGDGMIHAVEFADGRATYRNRYVRTSAFLAESDAGESLWTGIMEPPDFSRAPEVFKDTANTDIVWFNGELLALWWLGGDAYRVGLPDLETRGTQTFDSTLRTHIAAHPKVDQHTGEMLFIDYDPVPPYLTLGVVSPEGRVVRSDTIELDGPRLQHDVAFTDDWIVLFDFSFTWDVAAMARGRSTLAFQRDQPTRFGLAPRHPEPGASTAVRWFETDPCFMYHTINAWQEGDHLVHLVGCRGTEPLADDPANRSTVDAPTLGMLRLEPYLTHWTFDLQAGSLVAEQLWDVPAEFPRMDNRRSGRPSRFSYLQRFAPTGTLAFDAVVGHDLETNTTVTHRWPEGWFGGETVFCPRTGATDENDGYLVTFVVCEATGESEVHVLDAQRLDDEPVCRLAVPVRVPTGYHTWWVSAAELAGQQPA